MGKKYTTDIISIGDHSLDAPGMVQIDALIAAGLHSEAGYLTEESGTTRLTDAEIAAMGYIKTYTDTDTNTQLTSAEIAAMGYTSNTGTLTSSNDRNYITDTRGAQRAPSYYNDRYAQWDFQNSADTTVGGDGWHALLTVSKWSDWHASHRQEQLIFSGDHLWRRTAASDTTWGANKKIWDSGNLTNNSANWNEAHGWGNHADAGYLTSYNDTNTWRGIHDTPVDGETAVSISSNWAFDNVKTAVPAGALFTDTNTTYDLTGYISKGSTITPGASWTTATKFKSSGDIGQGAGNHSLQIISDINNDAFIAFHISSDYAIHFGLDNTSNRLYTGGWSDGTGTKYQLYDSRDFSIANVLNSNITLSSLGALGTGGKAADSELLDGLNSTAYMRDDGWNTSPGQDADTQTGMRSDFSYGNNAPNVGELLRFGAGNYSTQFSSQYAGVGKGLNFRTRNGDAASWNPWYGIWHTGNLTNNNQLTNGSNYVSYISTDQIGASLFYDINDTNYFLNPASTSRVNILQTVAVGVNKASSQTAKHGLSLYGGYVGGEPTYGMMFTGTAGSGTHGAVTSDWATYFTMNNSSNRGWIFRRVGSGNSASISAGGAATFDSNVKAPIFYDSNDTSRYVNPAGTSNLYIVQADQFQGYLAGTAANANTLDSFSSESFLRSDADDTVNAGVTYTWTRTDTAGLIFTNNSYNTKLYMGGWTTTNSNDISRIRTSSGNLHIDSAANGNTYLNWYSGGDVKTNSLLQSDASLRAPIFYDSNSTSYYMDPSNSNIAANFSGGIQMVGNYGVGITGKYTSTRLQTIFNMGTSYKLPNDGLSTSNAYGLYWSHQNAGATGGASNLASHGLIILEAGNYKGSWGGGRIVTTESVRAPIFYDSNNTGYYVNPASTSNLDALNVNTIYSTPIVYSSNQNAYALKIGASNNTAFDQGIKIKSSSTGQSYMSFNDRSEDALVLRGAKVGIGTDNPGYRLDVSGNGRFTSTVTATNFILSSDERKKTKIKDLPRNNINTNWKSFEMKNDEGEYRTGVIAQELEETHPEFVNTDSEGFKSVKYIDLLIAKIAELEARLEKLEK